MLYKKQYNFLLVLLFSALVITAYKPAEPTAYELVRKMFAKAKQLQGMKYNLVKRERINGKIKEENGNIKLLRNPFKVYMKQVSPNAGLEVLYVTGANGGKALVNTNSFPYITVSLDPLSGTMREGQHHTLLNAGFDYVVYTLEFLLNKYSSSAPNMVIDGGDVFWEGRACHKIILENTFFRIVDYTLKKGENILSIANKYRISEYMVLERNKGISSYDDVKPGQTIKIPNDYAQKMVIYLDKQNLLPILMQILDDKGLYEQYEYRNLQLNPQFNAAEFTKGYKDYKF